MTIFRRSLTLLSLLLLAALVASSAVSARGGGGRVIRSGSCTGPSDWKLKAKPDNGRLDTEFEVDQNRSGVRWHVVLRKNGNVIRDVVRFTQAPSGSFTVRAQPPNGAGTDRISARATRRSGEVCRGSLRI